MVRGLRVGFLLLIDLIHEGEDFGHDSVDLERDFGIEFGFFEDFDEVRVAVERDVFGFGEGDDFFRHQATAFGGEFGGGGRVFVVLKGGRFGEGGRGLAWHDSCISVGNSAAGSLSLSTRPPCYEICASINEIGQ